MNFIQVYYYDFGDFLVGVEFYSVKNVHDCTKNMDYLKCFICMFIAHNFLSVISNEPSCLYFKSKSITLLESQIEFLAVVY